MRPLCVELFAGMFGWSQGWHELGGWTVGFDIAHESYHGPVPPGDDLVLQDVLTLDGAQFRDASLILASPPCQFFSYTAMPWTRAKELAKQVRADPVLLEEKLALFKACFRIQREASAAAGRYIPMVVENVRGAAPWVGRSVWNYGSYHLYGDVPALMPIAQKRGVKVGGDPGFDSLKVGFQASAHRRISETWRAKHYDETAKQELSSDGVKQSGDWFGDGRLGKGMSAMSGRSPERKAASAKIAKIPLPLARWIAQAYWPGGAS